METLHHIHHHKPNPNKTLHDNRQNQNSSDFSNIYNQKDSNGLAHHPLLRGGQPPLPHRFSKAQMEVLTAIADTLFPSLPPPPNSPPHIKSFYELSASEMKVPEYAAGLFSNVINWSHYLIVYIALLLLCTRLGTLILCGSACFVKWFPFIEPFPRLPMKARETVLGRWASSRYFLFQAIFKATRSGIAWSCFAMVDSNGDNRTWKAIGYYVDPATKTSNKESRPLDGKVIDVKADTVQSIIERLTELGFTATEGISPYMQAAIATSRSRSKLKPTIKNGTENNNVNVTVKCDAVVVGSGSGGGVISGVLAKAGMKVLVIEKGDYFARGDYSQYEAASAFAMLEGPNNLVTEDGTTLIKAGATVGGGSAVNWAAALRTPDHVLKEWADEYKLRLFKEEKYKLAIDAVCSRINARVGSEKASLQNYVLREGCKKLGLPVDDVACNAAGEHYCGRCEMGCPTGAKQSTAETWLVDAVSHGAAILTGCKAERVVLVDAPGSRKKSRAVGVFAVPAAAVGGNNCNGVNVYVEAHVVVAAGGALQTPLLLRRSGLRNRHIGKNLHLHPTLMAWAYLPEADTAPETEDGRIFEGGIITACCTEFSGANRGGGYGALLQCPCLMPGSFGVIAPWVSGSRYKRFMQRYSRTVLVFTLPRDKTCGSVREDYSGVLRVNYVMSEEDRATSVEALGEALRVLAAVPGVKEVGTLSVHGDWSKPEDVEGLIERVRQRGIRGLDYSMSSAHQMGTCRMGASPEVSAVDERCETWEVEGLFVGDTSVFPTALGVNPMVTAQAIAFCTANNILNFLHNN